MLTWPMLEKIAVTRLHEDNVADRVGTLLPDLAESIPGGFIRVTRGPGSDDGITDSPLLDVESFHPDRGTSWNLIAAARESLLRMRNREIGGRLVDKVETATGPSFVFYGPHLERYVMSMRVSFRRSATT